MVYLIAPKQPNGKVFCRKNAFSAFIFTTAPKKNTPVWGDDNRQPAIEDEIILTRIESLKIIVVLRRVDEEERKR